MKIPKETIKEIAENLDCGLKCYLNKKNGTIITLIDKLNPMVYGEEEFDSEELEELEENRSDYLKIDKMDSNSSYDVMWDFTKQISDARFTTKLKRILNGKKPFRNFLWELENSNCRKDWFTYKQNRYNDYVKKIIKREIEL